MAVFKTLEKKIKSHDPEFSAEGLGFRLEEAVQLSGHEEAAYLAATRAILMSISSGEKNNIDSSDALLVGKAIGAIKDVRERRADEFSKWDGLMSDLIVLCDFAGTSVSSTKNIKMNG